MVKFSPVRHAAAFLGYQPYQPTALMATPRLSHSEAIL
ncbi:hypothetical protein NT01EI_2028 [Edwardsiella ictaluri 93-146]|uniref:Uncharacterized protein n=1 Tax=Edwardsiella ictaluri (strain 93-146) TaxID=634503 RepID=C5BBN3_EDWI9|nr:hypothetical protein NT01EI_2028 [Edwardsiella ictaluri 93-146]